MNTTWRNCVILCCLGGLMSMSAGGQASTQGPPPPADDRVVAAQVAALLRPILDERQKGLQQDERLVSNLLYALSQKKGRTADEALVVLMCFDVGESQEETDAVIARGRRMLPYLKKYRAGNPRFPGRAYPDSMLKSGSAKSDAFEGAVKAINHGWHSTADNPQG
jgi:hypothetical protein